MNYQLESMIRRLRFRLTRKLPTVGATDVLPELRQSEIRLQSFANQFGNVKLDELVILAATARALQPKHIFEFGTFDGLTSWHLLANSSPDAWLTTLDLPLDHPARQANFHDRSVGKIKGVEVGKWYKDPEFVSRIEQLYVDSMDFDCSSYEGKIDFCFVDASHDYAHVKRDTENALRMLSTGGVIFWHDYSRWWPGVQRTLDDLVDTKPMYRISGTSLALLKDSAL